MLVLLKRQTSAFVRWRLHFLADYPATVEVVRSVADNFSEEILDGLKPLDQEFLCYSHILTDLLFAYVDAHPEEFGKLPKPDDAPSLCCFSLGNTLAANCVLGPVAVSQCQKALLCIPGGYSLLR